MADKNMKAKINVEFEEAASRQQINSGEDVSTLFGKIRKFLADLKAVAFSGAYSDLSGTPDLTQYASKAKYGDTTINVGRKPNTYVGGYSTAEGRYTTASGYASHASGFGTKALHDNEVAFGCYNESKDDTLFSIGDGIADDARHNAFEITTTGGKLHDKDIATTDLIPTTLPANGGNADYAANAGKLGGLDASAYSTSIIKSVTFSAATTNGYIWTGIAFPKYVIGVDLGHFDVFAQFCKGSNEAAARAEWAMMFFSKDDVTTPLNGSFNGVIYYIDQR